MGVSRATPSKDYYVQPYRQDDGLERVLGERVRLLGRMVEDIESAVADRERLSEHVVAGIFEEYRSLRGELLPLLAFPFSQDRSWEQRRDALEERLQRLTKEARGEAVQRWRDQAALRREQREWLRQYRDLAERVGLLGIGQGAKQKR